MRAVTGRLKQGLQALMPANASAVCPGELDVLSAGQRDVFQRLARFDQNHLLSVHARLLAAGPATRDLEVATLLHDVAKGGTASQPGRVRLVHRVTAVLLERVPTGLTRRLAAVPAPPWRAGFALTLQHPALGAEEAARVGCSARACWLIRHHHDPPPISDGELRRLMTADDDSFHAGVDRS